MWLKLGRGAVGQFSLLALEALIIVSWRQTASWSLKLRHAVKRACNFLYPPKAPV